MKKEIQVSQEELAIIDQCSNYYLKFLKHNTLSTWKKYQDLYKSLDCIGKKQVLINMKTYLEEQNKESKNERK